MRTALVVFSALMLAASGASAQEAVHPGYPNVDRRVEIAPGESVHLLSRILVDRAPGMRAVRRLEFHYRTDIPASNAAGRAAQAERAAQVFGVGATDAGARTLAVAICDTEACAKRDEPPRVWYLFERKAGNVWKPVKQ
jgi:hypothetical protein